MNLLPNFDLVPDKIYEKIYTAVDWRKKDFHGIVRDRKIEYKLDGGTIESTARYIYKDITKLSDCLLVDEQWAVSETEFYYFLAHLINTKLAASLREYAGLAMPILMVLLLESIGEWVDDVSATTFTPIYHLPTEITRFEITSQFIERASDFFAQVAVNNNSKIELISPMRERLGLPLVALYPIDTGNERFIASAIPECDWRALVIGFMFFDFCRVSGEARPDERRIIFSTRKYPILKTVESILSFCRQ